MDNETLARRAEIARRLKAARWLAGGVRENARGKTGYEVVGLSADELAARPGMAENGITATLIGAIERMERYTPPMELRALAEALELPEGWLTDPSPLEATMLARLSAIESALLVPHHGSADLTPPRRAVGAAQRTAQRSREQPPAARTGPPDRGRGTPDA